MSVTLKLATSLDGRIATAAGESRWITGEAARAQAHRLRAMHQAVLVGVETVIADDPQLTVRLPGFVGLQPLRVVLDSRQRTPPSSKLVKSAARLQTVVIAVTPPRSRLTRAGVTVLRVEQSEGRPVLGAALAALEAHYREAPRARLAAAGVEPAEALDVPPGAMRVLVEGGGRVAASFLAAGLVDAVEWFRAPILLGGEGRPAVAEFVLKQLADAPRFRRLSVEQLGDDLWETYARA